MKRTAVVLALLAALSVASGSASHASPLIGERAVAVSSWLSDYLVRYLGAHVYGLADADLIANGAGAILGGDADDYANGKDDKKGPDSGNWQEETLRAAGGARPAGSGARATRTLK